LNNLAPVQDEDIMDMMTSSGFDLKIKPSQNMFLLVPNAKVFYEHIGHSIEKVEQELELGILQGPFPGLPFLPAQTVENSYVVQKDKERRIGRGDAPYNFLWKDQDCSMNANINLEDFPDMHLPSVMTFASNMRTAQSLHDATGDPRHYQEQLYTDWVSFYRYLVPMLAYWWTQCAILAPGGILVDAGTFFGSSSAPGLANRVMNVLLFFWAAMILLLLDKATTWDVTANGGTGGPCEPGHSNMFSHAGYNSAATDGHMPPHLQALADSLVAGIPYHHATGWDKDDVTRTWRQSRFTLARSAGLSMKSAIWNSLPYTASGFFDDSQQSAASCMMFIVLGCVLRLAELSGVQVSVPKLIWGLPGRVGAPTLLIPTPRLVEHISWTWTDGFAVALGRELNTVLWIVLDTVARITEASDRVRRLIADSTENASVNDMQSTAGLLMFMIAIRPELRALLNSTWRCLGRAKSDTTPWHYARRFRDQRTTLSKQAKDDLPVIIQCLHQRRGYACIPSTVEPGERQPLLFVMNDSAGRSSITNDTSFRGGGVWTFTEGASRTQWSNTQWTQQQLDKHSTETELANANCSLDSLVQRYAGFDIVEVLDNKSAVQTLRRLGCRSTSLEDQLRYRLDILADLPVDTRVFTVWSCREDGTLADMLSKDDMNAFSRALAERGLPPPAVAPFIRVKARM
jgi:hypothetical protein